MPVTVPGKKGDTVVAADEGPRADSTLEALAKLKPAFQPDGGTVTAGNAPGITDGAAALVIALRGRAERRAADGPHHRLRPGRRRARVAVRGADPRRAPPGREGRRHRIDDFDLIEINEAFAAQVLADGNELGFDWDRVNVNGGAIALGHPIGASGARVLTTLLYELRRRGGGKGLATLCLGGGGAVAMAIETV